MTRRRALSIGLLLAAGAAVNVAVAWSCAVWSETELDVEHGKALVAVFAAGDEYTPDRAWLDAIGYPDIPDTVFWEDRYCGSGVRVSEITGSPPRHDDGDGSAAVWSGVTESFARRTMAGWPLHSLECEHLHPALDPDAEVVRWRPRHAIEIGGATSISARTTRAMPAVLPLRPIPLGFVVDSLFYAVLLAVMLGSVHLMRRRWRLADGLCPRCRYPISGAPACTECGLPLPASALSSHVDRMSQ